MNPWQLAQQLRHILKSVAWPSGSQDVVFGDKGVYIYAGGVPEDSELPLGFPFAAITIDAGTPDEDDPDLILQTFSIAIVAEVAGDPLGEHAVIGGARRDFGKSAGAGVAQISGIARGALERLTGADGASIIVSSTGTQSPGTIGRGKHIATETFELTALCTSFEYYEAPQQFGLLGGDTWTWDGGRCQERFDFVQFRVGYVIGSAPVADARDLDATIYTGALQETGEVALAGRVYHLFADYNSHGGTALAKSSAPVDGTKVIL